MIIIGQTTVRFNINKQLWQAVNGHICATAPPGTDGKQCVIREAINYEFPAIAHLCRNAARRCPNLTKTIWNAAQFVINQAIYIPPVLEFEDQLGIILDGHKNHHICFYSGCLTCNRPDCQHVIAYLIQCQLWKMESNRDPIH